MTPPASIGRYVVQGELGRGAMGVVFRALDPALDRAVAVKVIAARTSGPAPLDPELETRFLREARVAARISHPNVVTVYDAGRDGSSLYLVMELVEGESLAARLMRGSFPSAAESLELAAQVADALGAAHALGVVHRDVKPGNVMLTRSGRVKVADFGVAKAVGEETGLTRTGAVVGSPAYMAPEQVRGLPIDGRADLFSLGVVLYELMMRRKPFPADTVTSLIYQILHEDPLADPAVSSALGTDVAAFLRRCLEKDPGRRIADAASFAARSRALAEAAAATDAVTTAPTAALPKAPPPAARGGRLAGAALLVVLAAVSVWGTLAWRNAVRQGPVATPVPTAPPPPPTAAPTPARVAARQATTVPTRAPRPTRTRVPTPPAADVAAEAPAAAPAPAEPTAPQVTAIFYCRLGVEFGVTPPEALVTVDGTAIGRADNRDHARADKKFVFSKPGRHTVKLSAPGFRTVWISVVVDPRAEEEIAEIDTLLPSQ